MLADQDRDDDNVALQRGGDLVMHVVALADAGLLRQQLHPAAAHDGDEDVTSRQRLVELAVEPLSGEQTVDIHEDVRPAELAGEPVADAPSVPRCVIAAIADENAPAHHLDREEATPAGA